MAASTPGMGLGPSDRRDLMRAFILRRLSLIEHGQGDVVVLGSTHSAGTLRVKEFLARNGHPYSYVDLERDADVQALLDRFHVRVDEVPVLICRGQTVLRNPTNEEVAACLGFNEIEEHAIGHVFLMTGASPNTQWLNGCMALDGRGFIKTGQDLGPDDLAGARWPLARAPYLLETSRPRVFAVGDVRSGNIKRVASAVGEGSIAISLVHKGLHE